MSTPYVNSTFARTVSPSGKYWVDDLIYTWQWNFAGSNTLTMSFPWANGGDAWFIDNYGQGEQNAAQHYALTSSQISTTVTARNAWAAVANVQFTTITDTQTNVGDIRVAWTNAANFGTSGYNNRPGASSTYFPSNVPSGGDIWLNPAALSGGGVLAVGTMLAAIGTALGISGPNRGSLGSVLPTGEDSVRYSITSYDAFPGYTNSSVNFYPTTPMLYDIAAIQYLYGANGSYHAGNDTYDFYQGQSYFQTIWDADGNDTITWNATNEGATINLNSGAWSDLGNALSFYDQFGSYISATPDIANNRTVAIAYGVIIENAKGGGAADVLIGNDLGNILVGGGSADILTGNAGDDILDGGSGDDTLNGGLGSDTLLGGPDIDTAVYSSNRSAYVMSMTATGYTITSIASGGVDTLQDIEFAQFADQTLPLSSTKLPDTSTTLLGAAINLSARAYSDAHITGSGDPIKLVNDTVSTWLPLQSTDFSSADLAKLPIGSQFTQVAGSLLRYDNLNASATVGITMIEGKRTLGISFEGTDFKTQTVADWTDNILLIDANYLKLRDFVNAVADFANSSDNQIERVLVTGHSLGGAAAQKFMSSFGLLDPRYIGITFGSPGTQFNSILPNNRLFNFSHFYDTVPLAGSARGYAVDGTKIIINIDKPGIDVPNVADHSLFFPNDFVPGSSNLDTGVSYRNTINLLLSNYSESDLLSGTNWTVLTNTIDNNDTLRATKQYSAILAGDGNDVVQGSNFADSISGGSGNDTINGYAGQDAVTFPGSSTGYRVTPINALVPIINQPYTTAYTVTDIDPSNGDYGTDTLRSIERLKFDDKTTPLSYGFYGKASDGYIFGAQIYVDANGNGLPDANEYTGNLTDAQGNFSFTSSLSGAIIAVGGTNIDTTLPNKLVLVAPEGSVIVSPVTTLIQAYSATTGANITDAETAVQFALGINQDVDLTQYDPLAHAGNDATALAVQRVDAQLAEVGNRALTVGTTFAQIINALASGVQSGQAINLASRSNLESWLGGVTNGTVLDAVVAINEAIAMAGTIQAISAIQVAASTGADAGRVFSLESLKAGAVDIMRLTGGQDVRIDFTNSANQITGLDLDGNGTIANDGVENNITGRASNFDVIDAYTRNTLDKTNIAQNFLGDIAFDGTGFWGDRINTRGNIVLGGLGADTIFGGIGNDFFAGGGVASSLLPVGGRNVTDSLSGGRNADYFFVAMSELDSARGNQLMIDGGTTADDPNGSSELLRDSDWLLFEAVQTDGTVTIILRDSSVLDPGESEIDQSGSLVSFSGQAVGTLRDIENLDASGNLYGFIDNIDVKLGGRRTDGSVNQIGITKNDGIGSTAQLNISGSNTSNILIAGSGNDQISSFAGDDRITGGQGNDSIDGSVGADTAVYSGKSTDYLVTFDALSSAYSVKDTNSSRDGTDKLTSVELLQFSDGVKQLATSDALLVGRVHQALYGKAQGSAVFNDSLTKVAPSGSVLDWVKVEASGLSALSDSAFSTLVLNNMSINNTSLTATTAFGTAQQAYDTLQQAMTVYLGWVGSANRGIVAAQVAQIIAGFEGETIYGVYGAAATAFNKQVASDIAHSINPQNTSEVVAVPVFTSGTVSAAGGNFDYMMAMGNYNYQIGGFASGDKIIGPIGVSGTLVNNNATDGSASIQYVSGGNTVSITLTGLSTAQDGALHGTADLNNVFGLGAYT